LILLDIGLPKLNGIEAAKQIVKRAPKSKIIFVSMESSADVVHAALSLGYAYVLKARATTELRTAIDAVLNGRQYNKQPQYS
jgi:DNA-binding NarL/FixJ family response regulator